MSYSIYLVALVLGFFSTVHCLGMCAGIVGALSMTIPSGIRDDRWTFTILVIAYNLGRISTYTILGVIAGLSGVAIVDQVFIESGQRMLQIIAGILLCGIGLNLMGLFPWTNKLGAIGYAIWSYIRPVGRYFFPVTNIYRAFASGMIWGMLPCAVIYSALLTSIAMANVYKSTLVMLFFGLGTLPGMIITGMISGNTNKKFQSSLLRYLAAILILALGIYSLSIPLLHTDMHQHHHQNLF